MCLEVVLQHLQQLRSLFQHTSLHHGQKHVAPLWWVVQHLMDGYTVACVGHDCVVGVEVAFSAGRALLVAGFIGQWVRCEQRLQ